MPAYLSSGSATGWNPRLASCVEISVARSEDLASTTRACGPHPTMMMFRALQNSRAESSHRGFLDRDKRDIEEVYEVQY
jgi:hypothetical protein